MKKALKASVWYFAAAMISGVLDREYTKWIGFNGMESLSRVHAHLLVLGVFFFLLLLILVKGFPSIEHNRLYRPFWTAYNAGLIGMTAMMGLRGLATISSWHLSSAVDASIAGIAGVSHIVLLVGFILFFRILFQSCFSKDSRTA